MKFLLKMLIISTLFLGTVWAEKRYNQSEERLEDKIPSLKSMIRELKRLDKRQKEVLFSVFERGTYDNLEYSACAIAWEESKLGKLQIPLDPTVSLDCGIFHNNTDTINYKYHIKNTVHNRTRICTDLITYPEAAYNEFKGNISGWIQRYPKQWFTIYMSYNGGFKRADSIRAYGFKIIRRIKAIKIVYGKDLRHYVKSRKLTMFNEPPVSFLELGKQNKLLPKR